MSIRIFIVALLLAVTVPGRLAAELLPYRDASLPVDERVEDLLERMTLREKIMQLNQFIHGENTNLNNITKIDNHFPLEAGSYIYYSPDAQLRNELQRKVMEETRLGIPAIFANDVIHGFYTVYPVSLAQGATWNTGLVEEVCAMAAREARRSGTEWTFSPMVDVARDPRWGRIVEGYGEDPYANAAFGAASVRGYQGSSLADGDRIAACLKHYVAYGLSTGGRDYRPVDVSLNDLWNLYLPPFKSGVEAGAATVMSAFNDINGVPASANRFTLTDVLRERWGFDGTVVSDWGSVAQCVNQGVAADDKEAACMAINAGVDIDMCDGAYMFYLEELVKEGKVSEKLIDDYVRRFLRLKFEMGLFEHPYADEIPREKRLLTAENLDVARRVAEESFVLLKNNGILPLSSDSRIAVIGPLATDAKSMLGNWHCFGSEDDVVTPLEGLRAVYGDMLSYAKGCEFNWDNDSLLTPALEAACSADVAVMCLGEHGYWTGESCAWADIDLKDSQKKLAKAVRATGKPMVLVLFGGRPVGLGDIEECFDAIIDVWIPGTMAGTAIANVLTGKTSPSGKLNVTFPWSTHQVPIYYNQRRNARGNESGNYNDMTSKPLYEFGHGLSYTTFEYGEPVCDRLVFGRDDKVTVSVDVTNTGGRDASEAVLWFVSDPVCSVARPVKELRHFEKQMIPGGETRTYRFEIDPLRDLAWLDTDGKPILEPGKYIISVGGRQVEIELRDEHNTRWSIDEAGGITWNIDGRLPHYDHLEMSGEQVSAVIRYGVEADGSLFLERSVVWPMLRTVPDNTHASLNRRFATDFVAPLSVNGLTLNNGRVRSVTFDGILKIVSDYTVDHDRASREPRKLQSTVEVSREIFPSTTRAALCERYTVTNRGSGGVEIVVPSQRYVYHTPAANGVEGSYTIVAATDMPGDTVMWLGAGESVNYGVTVAAYSPKAVLDNIDVETEREKRRELCGTWRGMLRFESPDAAIDKEFELCKIRCAESIYRTRGGLMHSPGGEAYYAAIWANDQAEYVNPFFPFMGYDKGNESVMNSFRLFARYMNDKYEPLPSSIISEGRDTWSGVGDRGDAAMIAYGAGRAALALGDADKARELWPLIEWCLEYCRRRLDGNGVVRSDCDELEHRHPSGDANLCTSSLYYDALRSASYLARELGHGKQAAEYARRADEMYRAIARHFEARVEGYDTYRYYDGNDVLRSWICIPLTMGIYDRAGGTVDALLSPSLLTGDGLLTQSGMTKFWDRSTLYALRGIFAAGERDRALDLLRRYSSTRLLGEHVPYPVEAWPEGNQRHLAAEGALYCRVITEGLMGIRPSGFHEMELTPQLPDGWNRMSLSGIHAFGVAPFDILVTREGNGVRVKVIRDGDCVYDRRAKNGKTLKIKLK